MSTTDGKEDKYEQLLAKIDWRASHPPRNYQYGAGRGAKGFVTTAELTTAGGSTGAKMTREEDDFFTAMGRLEEKHNPRRDAEEKKKDGGNAAESTQSLSTAGAGTARVKLSLDDLATLDVVPMSMPAPAPLITAATDQSGTTTEGGNAKKQAVSSSPSTSPGPSAASSFLVRRSARTEEGEAAEEHVFAEERTVTAYDVLKGKASAMQAGLQNVLAMGSTSDQTTWITHARAYREMGLTRRAVQTLAEGCAATGKKGKRIWEERLRYLATDNLSGRRRLLEEATSVCPSEETLWTQLLDVVPPLERVPSLQRAVLACPSSELLWLRLVRFVPALRDQKALLQKALQYTPGLPLLWSRLARLERFDVGKEMFQAAAARFPSLALVIEAAKYVEWHALTQWQATVLGYVKVEAIATEQPSVTPPVSYSIKKEEPNDDEEEELGGGGSALLSPRQVASRNGDTANLYRALRRADKDVADLVRTAQANYLDLGEAGSRHAWLSMALSLLQTDTAAVEAEAATVTGADTNRRNSAQVEQQMETEADVTASTPLPDVYVCTAAQMFLCVVLPIRRNAAAVGSTAAIPSTWMEDLVALLPSNAVQLHSVRCALWYTWVLLQEDSLAQVRARRNLEDERNASSTTTTVTAALVRSAAMHATVCASVQSAPARVIEVEVPMLLRRWSSSGAVASSLTMPSGQAHAVKGESVIVKQEPLGEEEEEELGRPLSATAAKTASGTSSCIETLPSPSVLAIAATLGLHAEASSLLAASPPSSPLTSILETATEMLMEAPLTISDALYDRGSYAAALAVVDLLLGDALSSSTGGVLNDAIAAGGVRAASLAEVHLFVARGKLLEAVGDADGADACLLQAIQRAGTSTTTTTAAQEEAWEKLCVLRRSQRRPIEEAAQEALRHCPRSRRLWLMLLEEKRGTVAAHQEALREGLAAAKGTSSSAALSGAASRGTDSAAAPVLRLSAGDLQRQDATLVAEIRELRTLYKTALSTEHCRGAVEVWVYVAERIEAELLQNVPAARALLTDAAAACAPALHSTRVQQLALARTTSPREMERQAAALARIGVTQAHLDAIDGTPGQALETVQEVLQRLPKTREGAFAMSSHDALGELLSLVISLEPPASRGRAAAQVMRQWRARDPLALCAVAQLYFTAGQSPRALDQALKAVRGSRGLCGDAVGLLWKLAEQPSMRVAARKLIQGKSDDEEEGKTEVEGAGASTVENTELPAELIRDWVLRVMAAAAAGDDTEEGTTTPVSPSSARDAASPGAAALTVVPNSGPIWIAVSKMADPSNVTLRGYRRSVVEMLREVADRTVLAPPASPSVPARN